MSAFTDIQLTITVNRASRYANTVKTPDAAPSPASPSLLPYVILGVLSCILLIAIIWFFLYRRRHRRHTRVRFMILGGLLCLGGMSWNATTSAQQVLDITSRTPELAFTINTHDQHDAPTTAKQPFALKARSDNPYRVEATIVHSNMPSNGMHVSLADTAKQNDQSRTHTIKAGAQTPFTQHTKDTARPATLKGSLGVTVDNTVSPGMYRVVVRFTIVALPQKAPTRQPSAIDKRLLQQAMRNTQVGHDVNFSDGTPFDFAGYSASSRRLFERGGSIALGSALNIASIDHNSSFYKNCSWAYYGKPGACQYPDEHAYYDLYNLWGVLFSERNNTNPDALANVKDFRMYVLYRGESTWRRVNFPISSTRPISWAGVYANDILTPLYVQGDANSNGVIKVIQNGAYSTVAIAKSGTYKDGKWYDAKQLVSHFGSPRMNPPADIDLSKVEGVYMQVDMRLDPSTQNAKVGVQVGIDVKHSWFSKTKFINGLGSTRIVTVTPQWKTVNWINYTGGQGSNEGGVTIDKNRILSTALSS
mgnify:CR=1 FL=1